MKLLQGSRCLCDPLLSSGKVGRGSQSLSLGDRPLEFEVEIKDIPKVDGLIFFLSLDQISPIHVNIITPQRVLVFCWCCYCSSDLQAARILVTIMERGGRSKGSGHGDKPQLYYWGMISVFDLRSGS